MAKSRFDNATLDLLNWEPPEAAVRFEDSDVRGATLSTRICRAMTLAIKDCGKNREQIAAEMSDYLGETVSVQMLNAYTSEARETHTINVCRFAAMVHATKDWRMLSIIPELFGFAVVDDRYISLIRATQMREKAAELDRLAAAEERRARGPR